LAELVADVELALRWYVDPEDAGQRAFAITSMSGPSMKELIDFRSINRVSAL
jgi:hypothetical protein